MAVTVRDIMDNDPISVTGAHSVETVLHIMRDNELTGVPVVNEGGRCVGIITEADLVLRDEGGDFHLPHYFEPVGIVTRVDVLEGLAADDGP